MGREIKRIALGFDWPINSMIWKGYYNPYSPMKCKICDGKGTNEEYQRLSDSWYSHLDPDPDGGGWSDKITQDEVQALLDAGRLMDFTRVPLNEEHREIVRKKIENGGNSWLPENNGYIPTAEEVNDWQRKNPFGHDGINHMICVEARAKRLGITDIECQCCDGHGHHWPDDKYEKLCDDWEPVEPPSGDGYQLWSTTSEGTPMSPVLETPEKLAHWLVDNKASTFGYQTASYEEWLSFIRGPGWAPTMVMTGGEITSGVQSVSKNKQDQ